MFDGCLRLRIDRPHLALTSSGRNRCPLRLFEQLFAHHCQFRADPAGLVLGPEADENSAAIASLWKVTSRPILDRAPIQFILATFLSSLR